MVSVVTLILFIWLLILLVPAKKFERTGIERTPLFLIFRSKKGIEVLGREAKKRRRFLKKIGNFGVILSLPLILMVFLFLFLSASHIIKTPDASPGLAPILPDGVADIPGVPSVPVVYWIISIAVILVFHEVMHGLLARVEDVPLKSLGILSVTIVPLGAFVEPDDEVLEKKGVMSKLRVYAAGSFGNFLAALIGAVLLLIIGTIIVPLTFQQTGVFVYNVSPDSAASAAGMHENLTITAINGIEIYDLESFREAVTEFQDGVPVNIETDEDTYTVTPRKSEGSDRAIIGVIALPIHKAKPLVDSLLGESLAFRLHGIATNALFWIVNLNLAVGLTNLLPIFPLDGGRIVAVLAEKFSPKRGKRITTFIYLSVLVLVFVNIAPFFGIF